MVVAALATTVCAQSSLDVSPTAGVPGQLLSFSSSGVNFYDLTVGTTITLQALELPTFSQAGDEGVLNFYMTDGQTPATRTHVGNETDATQWTLMSSGRFVSPGLALVGQSCQAPGVVIQPGTYGIAIEHVDVVSSFVGVTAFQTFSDANVTIENGTAQSSPFSSTPQGAFSFQGVSYAGTQSRVRLVYSVGSVPHACAEVDNYGRGCYEVSASPYQLFDDASAAQSALEGRSLRFLINQSGTGYTLESAGVGTFIPPGLAGVPINQVPAGDNTEHAITTAVPIHYPTEFGLQSTNSLYIHTNGYLSVNASNNGLSAQNFIPAMRPFLDAPQTAWWSWHDFNPTEVGSGKIVWEQDPVTQRVHVTWDGVESYPDDPANPNPSTVQFQFDGAGNVTILWVDVDGTGGSPQFGGDKTLIGFSPGGADSPDGGAFDVTALGGLAVSMPERWALKLEASDLPLLGTQIDLVTSNETSQSIGAMFFGSVQLPLGTSLAPFGMPGCLAYVDAVAAVPSVITNLQPGGMSVPLVIPAVPGLAGLEFVGQSIWLDGNANALGAVVSDGLLLTLGSF